MLPGQPASPRLHRMPPPAGPSRRMRRPDAALPLLLSSLALLLCTPAALAQAPRLFLQQPSDLAINARAAARGVEPFPSVLRWLAADAETAYAAPVVSVGDGKHRPEGWQRGDYVSLSPYWWPDWSKPNGLPYFRRDGLINPEVAEYTDKGKLVVNVLDYTVSLGYAHYFARTSPGAFPRPAEAYARKAVAQLKAWFVNPQTRMNPNMKFAQIRPGLPASATDGATGILDLSREIRFVEALALLANNTRLFDRELATGLRSWFSDMLTWLETSRPGRKAATSGNNLGIYYDGLIGILKLYLGRSDAATYIRNACQSRLDVHVRPSGEMPAETSRSDSLHYTIFALKGLLKLAMLSDRVTPNGRFGTGACWTHPNFKRAMAYILPAALSNDPKAWPHRMSGSRQFKPAAGWELYYAGWLAWGNRGQFRFGDAQGMWERAGGTGFWGRVWLPEPGTRTAVIGQQGAAAARRVAAADGLSVAAERGAVSVAPAKWPTGTPGGVAVGDLATDSQSDACGRIACVPFKLENGTVIMAADIDDYGE